MKKYWPLEVSPDIKMEKVLAVRGKPRYKDKNKENWLLEVSPDMKMKKTGR